MLEGFLEFLAEWRSPTLSAEPLSKIILIALIGDYGKRVAYQKTQEELYRLNDNYEDTREEILTKFPFEFGLDTCCADCKYGGNREYRELWAKQERRDRRREELEQKLKRWSIN